MTHPGSASEDYSHKIARGASLSVRGQWVRALKSSANLGGGAHSEKRTQTDCQAPYKPPQLYAPVPARYEAHSSDCSVELFPRSLNTPGKRGQLLISPMIARNLWDQPERQSR